MYTSRTLTKEEKASLRADAIERLQAQLTPGQTVYCILRHVSSSGTSRRISFVVPSMEIIGGQSVATIEDISYLIARILDLPRHEGDGGLTVRGCGMDMGGSVVYDLSAFLFSGSEPQLRHEWL